MPEQRPPLAVQMSTELLNASIGAGGLCEHLELELRSQVITWLTADHREAWRGFNHRREQQTVSGDSPTRSVEASPEPLAGW